jgi:glutathione synthase/RimK-type ligase-like ATP-grasp enzyme
LARPSRTFSNSIYDLPVEVADQLTKLLAALGLEYGASDWIVTSDGRHVLLEVNPHGAWLWLDNEIDTLDITGALAQAIADHVRTSRR